ncbi:MAG: hypothetical protein KKC18_15935 [Chloroflexi bacterium]|nr:hypothetical protein [Chloroflexota bacterium]
MRYNWPMDQSRRLRLWFALALAVVLVATAALWLRGALSEESSRSPLPTPLAAGESPLPTPAHADTATPPPASWTGGGAALLWVALGVALALIVVFFILRWEHRSVG